MCGQNSHCGRVSRVQPFVLWKHGRTRWIPAGGRGRPERPNRDVSGSQSPLTTHPSLSNHLPLRTRAPLCHTGQPITAQPGATPRPPPSFISLTSDYVWLKNSGEWTMCCVCDCDIDGNKWILWQRCQASPAHTGGGGGRITSTIFTVHRSPYCWILSLRQLHQMLWSPGLLSIIYTPRNLTNRN